MQDREEKMLAHARATTLQAGPWLTAAQVGDLAGWDPSEANKKLASWLAEGKIFALRSPEGQQLFPAFALDSSNCFTPLKQLAEVILILSGKKDSWGIAIWLASVNGYLGGMRPLDAIVGQPDAVVRAAEDEAAGVLHG